MGRILSIDYGKKRTGLAVTDPLQIIAGGLATVATHQLFDWLRNYLQKEEVERIVVGEPRQTNGQPSENLPRVQAFVRRFQKEFPSIPVTFFDCCTSSAEYTPVGAATACCVLSTPNREQIPIRQMVFLN